MHRLSMANKKTCKFAKSSRTAGVGRSRSFGGCVTCRSRHMKCDETRPACRNCKTGGLLCAGYEKYIFFDFENGVESGSSRFRRPLLTEQERKRMSEWLVSKVSSESALRHIFEIDELCEHLCTAEEVQVSRGPFSVFRTTQGQPTNALELSSDHLADKIQSSSDNTLEEDSLSWSDDFWPMIPQAELLDQNYGNVVGSASDIPPIGSSILICGQNLTHEFFNNITVPEPLSQYNFMMDPNAVQGSNALEPISVLQTQQVEQFGQLTLPSNITSGVPSDAVFLVKHYSTFVLRLLTPFRHSKTPWHVLFLPHVKTCLAALTLGEDMNYASLSAFYGTLAISAFSLGGTSQSPKWLEQGKLYEQYAKKHIRSMLKTAYDVPKTAKYKSILIALLTMVQVSMMTGDQDQTDCYLLEAEKLIRIKGLNRKKSRKVRLLHHCYAFERMFHESTLDNGSNSTYRQHVRNAIQLSGADAYSVDALSFRLGDWTNLEKDMMRLKGCKESENDLHLQIPGEWLKTLYPEIFGLPEPYLLLLSIIIRLAREKEGSESDCAGLGVKEFATRAKSLEKCINHVAGWTSGTFASLLPQISPHILDNMLDAMQHSLAIYFYRRIYDLDESLLQNKVVAIRDCLTRLENANTEDNCGLTRLVWPAFIAACEAMDLDLQEYFARWFEDAAKRSGLPFFKATMKRVEVYRQKRSNLRVATETDIYPCVSSLDYFVIPDD